MSSYCRSRYPTISPKLSSSQYFAGRGSCGVFLPCLVVNLVSKTGRIDDSQRNACSFFIQFQLYEISAVSHLDGLGKAGCAPTVIGLILTPSSMWAFVASSASFPERTFLPHRVFTNVVRPEITGQWRWSVLDVVRRTCARGTTNHQAELDTLLHILLSADLDL